MKTNCMIKPYLTLGIEAGRGRVPMQREIDRLEVERVIVRLKCGKFRDMDKKGEVTEDWKRAIIVPLYKGKGSRSECSSYRGISLLSVAFKS